MRIDKSWHSPLVRKSDSRILWLCATVDVLPTESLQSQWKQRSGMCQLWEWRDRVHYSIPSMLASMVSVQHGCGAVWPNKGSTLP